MKFAFGMKTVTAIALISSFVLIGLAIWVLCDSLVDLNHQLKWHGVKQWRSEKRFDRMGGKSLNVNTTKYRIALKEMEIAWHKNQPVLVGLSSIAITIGVAQLMMSLIVFFTETSGLRKSARKWLVMQVFLFFALVVCLLSTIVLRVHGNTRSTTWGALVDEFHVELKIHQSEKDFDGLIAVLKLPLSLYYGAVGQDIAITVLLLLASVYLMRGKEYGYQPQP